MAGDKHGAEETQEQEAAQEHGNEQTAQDQQEVAAGTDWEAVIAERDARIGELEDQVADAAKNAETAEALRGEIAGLTDDDSDDKKQS